MITTEVKTIRQKIDKRKGEALSQPWKSTISVLAVGNSIHYFPMSLKQSGKHALAWIILIAYSYLNGETNRRWRRDTPCSDAKRWPRNNNIATASGGVNRIPRYQLIEEGIPT